ncbi:MAG: hypothetical protein ABI177_08130 [Edaphobacter sp.]
MQRQLRLAGLYVGLLTVSAVAQQAVTTTGGTTNAIPKFSGAATLVNSAITESGGNVGIGTTKPLGTLTIASPAADGQGTAAYGLVFADSLQNGSPSPWAHAAIYSIGSNGYNGSLVFATDGDGLDNFGVTEKMRISPDGSVGIGTASPAAKLEVNGNFKLTSGSGASITFADGTIQSTAWKGSLCGGDYAESVDVSGDRTRYEPGDVLVVDPEHPGQFLKAAEPYSTLVAGIYSTKPGLLGRRQTTDPKTSTTEVPMAMVGIVPTKVSAENGSIRPGDLLVTSSILGHAMKGTDRNLLTGAIVGKALGTLESGTGVIEVLVSLQ